MYASQRSSWITRHMLQSLNTEDTSLLFLHFQFWSPHVSTNLCEITSGSPSSDWQHSIFTYHSPPPGALPSSALPSGPHSTNLSPHLEHQTEQLPAIYSPSLAENFTIYSKAFPLFLPSSVHSYFSYIKLLFSVFPCHWISPGPVPAPYSLFFQ